MKPIHILLIEDNEGDIMLTTEALREGKISNKVTVIRDGWEAVRYLEKMPGTKEASIPDLILLDVNLPKMNGHEVLAHIKKTPHLQHLPVIMLTTSSSESDVLQSYKNHANCYITKPVEVDSFLEVVASIEDFWINIVQLPTQTQR